MSEENYRQMPTSVKGLFSWLSRVPAKTYAKYPFLGDYKTKKEALAFLQGLIDKGVVYI